MPGVVHGMRSLFLQDEYGQVLEATSISAGLDYPGVGPEHAMLAAKGRAEYFSATDEEALEGFQLLAATEGIVPALEPAHAIGWLAREAGHSVPKRLDGARHAVGPGRQGRGPGRRDASARSIVSLGVAPRAHCRAASDADGRKLLVPYVTGGLGREWCDVVRAVDRRRAPTRSRSASRSPIRSWTAARSRRRASARSTSARRRSA